MKINRLRNVTAVVAGVILLATGAPPADARPLKKEACNALAHERKKLATLGAEKAIIKGPEWTQANMPAQMMGHVRRYLIVEEMLRFRCKGVNLPTLLSQQASVISTGKKKQKKPPAAQPIKPPPPLPKLKPVTKQPEPAKNEALAAVPKNDKPEQAKTIDAAAKEAKTVALPVKAKTPAATPSQGADAKAAAVVVPLPARKPTPAERIAHARAIAAAVARAAALRKKRSEALRVTTPDIQQLLLSNENN